MVKKKKNKMKKLKNRKIKKFKKTKMINKSLILIKNKLKVTNYY